MSTIAEMPISNPYLTVSVSLAALAALGYLASRARHGRAEFTLLDAMMLATIVAIVGATAVPFLEGATRQAKSVTLLENLHTLRSQIELYKIEHGGEPPLLYEGTFPQLIRATNAAGIPGPSGSEFPHGPYLRTGVPLNPMTGRSIVTLTDTFPPPTPSGNGGWIYHQQTGQIAADSEDFLNQ